MSKIISAIYFSFRFQGADIFSSKINIEVQWANEATIAAIEKNGGVITTAFFDIHSLWILKDPESFFRRGYFYTNIN